MNQNLFKPLSEILSSPDCLILDLTGYENYFHDATIETGRPSAIVMAESDNDIIAVINFCKKNNIPLVARGAGTGLSGGCVPKEQAVLLSVEKMTDIKIDPATKTAIVQPGVITKTVIDRAAKFDLTYPPDPASYEESTIAGNVAENAGGLRCKKYGVTRDYIVGLKGYTIDGELITTGIFNDYQGFRFEDLIIGSEGTLLIISEIALRLIEKPDPGDTILVAFDNPKNAAQTVSDICINGIIPTVMEFLDGDAADCSNRYEANQGLLDAAAILIIETKPSDTETVKSFCRINNCSFIKIETDIDKAQKLWKIRRNLSEAVKSISKIRISEDVVVPISKFPLLVEYVADTNKSSPLRINSFGHAGDGNLHVNFLSMTGNDSDRQLIEEEIEKLLKRTVELGGTLSGEHGIGLAKRHYLPFEFNPATLNFMKQVKRVFDKDNLLNPQKIFL